MSDIVYTCQKKGKGGLKVCLLIEHKSFPDKNTPIQIGSYIFSSLLRQIVNKQELEMIIPVLLYHGRKGWEYQTLADLFKKMDPDWKKFLPDFDYIYNNLGDIPDQQVEALNNKFLAASILALKQSFEKDWLEQTALMLLVWLEYADWNLQRGSIVYLFERSGLEEGKIREIVERLPIPLKDTVMNTAEMFMEKGKKIGFEAGLEKGKAEFVVNLLKNTDFDVSKIAALANVSEQFVFAIREELLKK
ncbi:hypothetical protein E0F88_02470 [Dyadobacter psychrotolerans]|uniref:Transposase (putative) YhgA-like domain-containing protein n=1 Tax=Dyadobacter psychrotolerans TaxID=2541721 RepID=A0A4R5E199_9BACT|nr:hypothetical protein E0F88_02470 [Dyadobacter psychrotolerans]